MTERHRDSLPLGAIRDGSRVACTVRAAVPLKYGDRTEYVAEDEDSIGRLDVGAPVELGHGGRVVGSVIAVRRSRTRLDADLRIDDHATRRALERGDLPHVSADYVCRLDASGYQRDVRIAAIALVPKGRCSDACGVRQDAAHAAGPCCPACGERALARALDASRRDPRRIDAQKRAQVRAPSPVGYRAPKIVRDSNGTRLDFSPRDEPGPNDVPPPVRPKAPPPDGKAPRGTGARLPDPATLGALDGTGDVLVLDVRTGRWSTRPRTKADRDRVWVAA